MIGLILLGFFTAVLAGMGLGGGILLIPALLIFYQTGQIQSQTVSLITYIPMALTALLLHSKEKNLNIAPVKAMLPAGTAGAVLGAIAAGLVNQGQLRKLYGVFLIVIGIIQFAECIKQTKNTRKDA